MGFAKINGTSASRRFVGSYERSFISPRDPRSSLPGYVVVTRNTWMDRGKRGPAGAVNDYACRHGYTGDR